MKYAQEVRSLLQKLTFREMCGESAFIPPSELTTIRSIGSGSFAKGTIL